MPLDWSQCPAVERIPGKVSGAWVFKGTRMPVTTVFENLEAGANIEDIMEWFDISREQITAVVPGARYSLSRNSPRVSKTTSEAASSGDLARNSSSFLAASSILFWASVS